MGSLKRCCIWRICYSYRRSSIGFKREALLSPLLVLDTGMREKSHLLYITSRTVDVCDRYGGYDGRELHPRDRRARSEERQAPSRRDPLSSGAERLPAHRARQVHLSQFRARAGARRRLPPALRRHESEHGERGGRGGDPGRRALAGLRFGRSEEHTSELQSPCNLVCRLLLEKKKRD